MILAYKAYQSLFASLSILVNSVLKSLMQVFEAQWFMFPQIVIFLVHWKNPLLKFLYYDLKLNDGL